MVNNVQMAATSVLAVPNGIMMNRRRCSITDGEDGDHLHWFQGEPTSALTRMANGTHQHVTVHQDDTVILSSNRSPQRDARLPHIDNLYRAART